MRTGDRDYHRKRAEAEIAKALCAKEETSAVAHLELARMHRARRLAATEPMTVSGSPIAIFRTDKEA